VCVCVCVCALKKTSADGIDEREEDERQSEIEGIRKAVHQRHRATAHLVRVDLRDHHVEERPGSFFVCLFVFKKNIKVLRKLRKKSFDVVGQTKYRHTAHTYTHIHHNIHTHTHKRMHRTKRALSHTDTHA